MAKILIILREGVDVNSSTVTDFVAKLTEAGFDIDFEYTPDQDYKYGVSLGGDGTYLKIASKLRGKSTPIIGINMGHVGFLADANIADIDFIVSKIISGDLCVKQRFPIEARVTSPNSENTIGWAINEAALEKASESGMRNGMLNLRIEINGTPFSEYGCDGLIAATSSGSTAHAFSAGGPIIYPDVKGFELLPIAAHALFTRPIILDDSAVVSVYLDGTRSSICFATLTFDGSRSINVEVGSKIDFYQSATPVYSATFSELSHTRKLVEKFSLPVRALGH
jgi:NAD+ kinase